MSIQEIIIQFLGDGDISSNDRVFYCESRDQSSARLPRWMNAFTSYGLNVGESAKLTAILGELTNNSFDHNLGRWHQPAGCMVAYEKTDKFIDVFVADRGQGIIASLGKSLSKEFTPRQILKKAFEERISGRAPERRGNGLKFVLKHVQESNSSLLCCSQASTYTFGEPQFLETTKLPADFGTLIRIQWSLT